MSYLIGAVAILHEASVISAVLSMEINNLQGSIDMKGHPSGWLDYLTPLLPDNRGFGLANAFARQHHVLLPRHDKHGSEWIYGGTNCNKVSSEDLSPWEDKYDKRDHPSWFVSTAGQIQENISPDGEDLKLLGKELCEKLSRLEGK